MQEKLLNVSNAVTYDTITFSCDWLLPTALYTFDTDKELNWGWDVARYYLSLMPKLYGINVSIKFLNLFIITWSYHISMPFISAHCFDICITLVYDHGDVMIILYYCQEEKWQPYLHGWWWWVGETKEAGISYKTYDAKECEYNYYKIVKSYACEKGFVLRFSGNKKNCRYP